MLRNAITAIIDFFYPLFQRIMSLHNFRYAACGGANVCLDIALYFIAYNFILHKEVLELGFIAFQPHIAAFLLSKYIVWRDSLVLWHIQLFRYFLIVIINLCLNYIFIKIFVEYFNIYPTISKLLTTVIIVIFSYLSQKHFTFKVKRLHR